jgi:hypoxanthine phosphoribosyltransferase
LGLKNYKINLSRKEYNCEKQPGQFMDDMVKKQFSNKTNEYVVCEGINDNLEGKNIILIDEMVSTGKTMEECCNYLKKQKNVNIIYPASIALYKYRYMKKIHINNVINQTVMIWPWGYDN